VKARAMRTNRTGDKLLDVAGGEVVMRAISKKHLLKEAE
jgi:hypothetical protein